MGENQYYSQDDKNITFCITFIFYGKLVELCKFRFITHTFEDPPLCSSTSSLLHLLSSLLFFLHPLKMTYFALKSLSYNILHMYCRKGNMDQGTKDFLCYGDFSSKTTGKSGRELATQRSQLVGGADTVVRKKIRLIDQT